MSRPTEEQTYREGVKKDLKEIKDMLSYTNGKVKKIILALVGLGGIVIGGSTSDLSEAVRFVTSLIK